MTTVVTIESVTTGDAAPADAPHRISNKASKDTATVHFSANGAGAVRAWLIRVGGAGLLSGERAGGQGVICGVTRCGEAGPLARPLTSAITEDVTYAEASPEPDGSYPVNVYAATDEGWAL